MRILGYKYLVFSMDKKYIYHNCLILYFNFNSVLNNKIYYKNYIILLMNL